MIRTLGLAATPAAIAAENVARSAPRPPRLLASRADVRRPPQGHAIVRVEGQQQQAEGARAVRLGEAMAMKRVGGR
jgi:hypothetical protein